MTETRVSREAQRQGIVPGSLLTSPSKIGQRGTGNDRRLKVLDFDLAKLAELSEIRRMLVSLTSSATLPVSSQMDLP
jgi:hypothetical protein